MVDQFLLTGCAQLIYGSVISLLHGELILEYAVACTPVKDNWILKEDLDIQQMINKHKWLKTYCKAQHECANIYYLWYKNRKYTVLNDQFERTQVHKHSFWSSLYHFVFKQAL